MSDFVTLASAAVAGGVFGAVLNFFRDVGIARANAKKAGSDAVIAESTAADMIEATKIATFQKRLEALEQAHAAETRALNATLDNVSRELLAQRTEVTDLRDRYRSAISYIRLLRYTMVRAEPQIAVPEMPDVLQADIDY